MIPPMVSFVTWNRAGLNARNLRALLHTTDEFELYIIDNNSQDDSWKFIQTLQDRRIKDITKFDVNRGLVYAMNYTLARRKKDQFFITLDSDVYVKTPDWITQFLRTMQAFPEVGLLGAERDRFFAQKNISPQPVEREGRIYYPYHVIIGCCLCIRPELFSHIGYWNEETGVADLDICSRINQFTPYRTGFIPDVHIDQTQNIPCEDCLLRKQCSLIQDARNCFEIYRSKYRHGKEFAEMVGNKERIFFEEIHTGQRTAFCASIHDPDSMRHHHYNKQWADGIFRFFIEKAN